MVCVHDNEVYVIVLELKASAFEKDVITKYKTFAGNGKKIAQLLYLLHCRYASNIDECGLFAVASRTMVLPSSSWLHVIWNNKLMQFVVLIITVYSLLHSTLGCLRKSLDDSRMRVCVIIVLIIMNSDAYVACNRVSIDSVCACTG